MQGRSMLPLLNGTKTDWRKSFLAEYYVEKEYPNTPALLAVRTQQAKLVTYPGHDEWTEVFDLAADPYEIRNLANDPAHRSLRKELETEMKRLCQEISYQIPPAAVNQRFNPKDSKDPN
jgi:arylsulfatase A-like enzyme